MASPAFRRISARSSTVLFFRQLLGARHRHHGAHAGPAGEKQRQTGQALDLAAYRLERHVGIEHRVGRLAVAARIEVHEQEGEVVEHVDGGQRLAELQGVERHRHAVDQHDVAEVQIAVAAADAAGVAALRSAGLARSNAATRRSATSAWP